MQCGRMLDKNQPCNELAHTAHVVKVQHEPGGETHDAVLLLCDLHTWSHPVFEALREASVAIGDTRRVVVDIKAGHVPVVYVEAFGDEKRITVTTEVEVNQE